MTSEEFLPQMARLAAAYRKDISGATAEVYFEALADLAPMDLTAAIAWAIKTSRYLPTPAEILDRAKYERQARLKAIPPADAPQLPEWVTEPTAADVPSMLADLLPKLAASARNVAQVRPQPTLDSVDMSPQDRAEKARGMLEDYRAYIARLGLVW